DPLGRRVTIGGPEGSNDRQVCEVVGVVKTGKYRSLGEDPRPFMYQSYWQNYVPRVRLAVRARGRLGPGARRHAPARAGPGPEVGGYGVETMKKLMLLPLIPAHAAGLMLGVIGGLGLLLASVGVTSYIRNGEDAQNPALTLHLDTRIEGSLE